MVIQISEFVSVWQKYNPIELSLAPHSLPADYLAENPTSIKIKNDWFDVIPISRVCRSQNKDGYYRAIYIQIDYSANEYYIGKVNRKRWSEVKRYQGSGLRFSHKYKAHSSNFCRYYIALCNTAGETEELEAKIVDDTLLTDEKCLNLVQGGGGTSQHINHEEISQQRREYMKKHPEQAEAMLKKAKELYHSGNTTALEERSKKIRETMNQSYYKELTRERIKNWQSTHPDEYQKSRKNLKKSLKTKETIEKKQKSFEKWKNEYPEKYLESRKNLIYAAHTNEAEEKRAESLKRWKEQNPQQTALNAKKRAIASAAKSSKGVVMKDLDTGEVLKQFKSIHDAARWLVDSKIAKNINCISSISAVCRKSPCTTGYGYRKKAYGYGWEFVETDDK